MLNGKLSKATIISLLPRIIPPTVVFIVTLACGLGYTSMQPKLYQGSARIWIQMSGIPLSVSSEGGSGAQVLQSPLTSGGENALNTACEVIGSEAVMTACHEALLKKLPASKCPPIWALQMVNASVVKDADIVKITYVSPDPQVAVAVVSAVVDAFFRENNIQTAGNAAQSKVYLEKQLKEAREKYKKTREDLRRFQEANQTVDLAAQTGGMLDQRSDLEKSLAETRQLIASKDSKLKYLEQHLGFGSEDVMTVDAISKDEMLIGLRKTIAEDEVKIVDLSSKYQEEHPRMKRLRSAVNAAQQSMATRLKELMGKQSPNLTSEPVAASSHIRDEMLGEMVQLKAEQVADKQRQAALEKMLLGINGKLSQVPSQQLGLADLVRADEVASSSLTAIEKELQTVSMTESVAMGTSNLQVIDHPEASDMTSSAQKIAVLISLALAALTAFAQHLLDPRIRSIKDLPRLLPAPIEAWIPTLAPGARIVDILNSLQRLRISIKNLAAGGRKLVVVSSPNAKDGKSTVAYGLALSLSKSGQRVLLIDANLQRPGMHILCKQQASPGLADYLNAPSEAQALHSVHRINQNLLFIPAGQVSPDSHALSTAAFKSLLEQFDSEVDVFLIDTSDAGQNLNSLKLPEIETAVIVIVRLGHTLRRSLQLLAAQLKMQPSCEYVTVINDADEQTIASNLVTLLVSCQQDAPEPVQQPASASALW